VAHSLDEVRMTSVPRKTRIVVSEFIEEVAATATATLVAETRGVSLIVLPVEDEPLIDADRHVLGAVIGNLLQNAFKFTRPHSAVTLRVYADTDRLLIQVEDECGGLPGIGDAKELSPSFDRRGGDRSGLGIGLAFSRWGAEANGGRLYARNLPGKGCIFTVDLPRIAASATSPALA
jgi:hypothetical protein